MALLPALEVNSQIAAAQKAIMKAMLRMNVALSDISTTKEPNL
jgi:hypothetical protein